MAPHGSLTVAQEARGTGRYRHGTRSRSSMLMITLAVRLKREMGPLRALKIPGFLQNGLQKLGVKARPLLG
jgi:hypothetical protein